MLDFSTRANENQGSVREARLDLRSNVGAERISWRER